MGKPPKRRRTGSSGQEKRAIGLVHGPASCGPLHQEWAVYPGSQPWRLYLGAVETVVNVVLFHVVSSRSVLPFAHCGVCICIVTIRVSGVPATVIVADATFV